MARVLASSSVLRAARWLVHQRGFSVMPLQPRSKRPALVSWKILQSRPPTDAELVASFAQGTPNIGIITGAISRIVVVDGDSLEAFVWMAAQLPTTSMRTRTAKGEHFFYQHPGGSIRNRARLRTSDRTLAIDIRADGGYVLAPGCIHPSGMRYQRLGDWPPVDQLPVFDPSWLEAQGGPRTSTTTSRVGRESSDDRSTTIASNDRHLLIRARAYLAATPRPEIGCGSDAATFQAACRLTRGFALSPDDAEALLWAWAGDRPGWTRPWIAQKVTSALKHGREPIGGYL